MDVLKRCETCTGWKPNEPHSAFSMEGFCGRKEADDFMLPVYWNHCCDLWEVKVFSYVEEAIFGEQREVSHGNEKRVN